MANTIVEYLKKSIRPGGTDRRMKEWVGAMLLLQVLATVLPGKSFEELTMVDSIILSTIILFVFVSWSIGKKQLQITLSWITFLLSMLILPVGAWFYGSGKEEMIIISSWSAAMYIYERRGYISFTGFVIAMLTTILTLAVSTMVSVLGPDITPANTLQLIAVGIFNVGCNCYLLIVDFRHGKHRLDYFERHFDKVNELAATLSKILMAEKTIEEILWDVTRECIPLLGLDDFVIYRFDKKKEKLVQVAVYGQKQINQSIIKNPIEISPGEGIVGRVFTGKEPILISDTSQDDNYIIDDKKRYSELAVPILIGDRVYGVIDSEHEQKAFYTQTHLQFFSVIASFCSIKAAQEEIKQEKLQAEKDKLEIEKIKELEQLKNKFITNISHDLKTPLSLILGPANNIYQKTSDEFIRQQSNYIIKNTDHLMSMVEQLLQLNKIEQGIDTVNIDTIELDVAFSNIKEQYESLAVNKNVDFTVTYNTGIVLSTDSYKLMQCVHNLLQNAFKYTPEGGSVQLVAEKKPGDNVSISVTDTGLGIKTEEQKKIFDRFYKIDVNNHKGTGIGLSLVKEYVTQLKGTITLFSEYNKGASFTIDIPLNYNHSKSQKKTTSVNDLHHSKEPLVLVVEDHEELNVFIAQSLEQEGYRCIQAYNGRQGDEMTNKYLPDLIISDLMMPEMNGEEFVETIKNNDATGHIPIVILTAKGQVDSRVELYTLGADNYIHKPFKMNELIAVVSNTLKQRQKLRDTFYKDYLPLKTTPVTISEGIKDKPEIENSLVKQCTEYVLAHLDDPALNVNALCSLSGMGRNKLQQEVKSATGLTPVEFIRSVRLHEAYKLILADKQHNISEIAYITGFSNLSYFSRSFKGQFGFAPSEAQEQITTS